MESVEESKTTEINPCEPFNFCRSSFPTGCNIKNMYFFTTYCKYLPAQWTDAFEW